MLIGGKDFTLIGRPLLPRDAFRIVATVVEKNLSQHKICYKHKKAVKTNNPKTRCKLIILFYCYLYSLRIYKLLLKFSENLTMIYILIVFLAGMRDYTTTLRINSIELLKPVDNTIDRTGFEPPMNKDPMSVL